MYRHRLVIMYSRKIQEFDRSETLWVTFESPNKILKESELDMGMRRTYDEAFPWGHTFYRSLVSYIVTEL